MALFAYTILPAIPLLAWFLAVGWSPGKTEGEVLLKVPVSLLARLKMLWIPYALGTTAILIGIMLGQLHWWIALAYLAGYAVMLGIPVSYTLTTLGIRAGTGVFRRWTEFAGVRRSPSGAVLQGGQRASSYPIFLSGNREDDEFVHTLKILVQDSYKGRATARARLRGEPQSAGETNTTSSMSH